METCSRVISRTDKKIKMLNIQITIKFLKFLIVKVNFPLLMVKKVIPWCSVMLWFRGVVVITTAHIYSAKPGPRFCAVSYFNPIAETISNPIFKAILRQKKQSEHLPLKIWATTFNFISWSLRYTNPDLKICQYLLLYIKIICWRFHFKTPFYFLRYANVRYVKSLFTTFRNNRICQNKN